MKKILFTTLGLFAFIGVSYGENIKEKEITNAEDNKSVPCEVSVEIYYTDDAGEEHYITTETGSYRESGAPCDHYAQGFIAGIRSKYEYRYGKCRIEYCVYSYY